MISEQTLINISYFIAHDIFNCMIYFVIMIMMITPKYNKTATLFILTAICIILESVIRPAPLPLYFVSCFTMFYVPALLVFREKKKICFFAASILLLGTIVLDMIFSAITLSTYGYYPTKTVPYTWTSVYISALFNVLYFCAFMPIVIIWRKKIKKYSVKSMTLFMLFPIGQALFLSACTYPTWAMGADFNVFDNPFMLIAVIISAVSDILMFIALRDNNSLEIAKARAEQAEKEMELQSQYYSELSKKMEEIKQYRHDINNLIYTAEALITEDSSQVSKDFIEEMKQKSERMKIPVYDDVKKEQGAELTENRLVKYQ